MLQWSAGNMLKTHKTASASQNSAHEIRLASLVMKSVRILFEFIEWGTMKQQVNSSYWPVTKEVMGKSWEWNQGSKPHIKGSGHYW